MSLITINGDTTFIILLVLTILFGIGIIAGAELRKDLKKENAALRRYIQTKLKRRNSK